LGIIIDENLNWQSHIQYITKKIAPTIAVLKKAKHCLNRSTLMLIYFSQIHSWFTYLLPIWGTAPCSHFSTLVVKHIILLSQTSNLLPIYQYTFQTGQLEMLQKFAYLIR
jgi:hypothetical protein